MMHSEFLRRKNGRACDVNVNIEQSRKLTYVLNHYSDKDVTHFAHIRKLLETIADRGVRVRLLIEKSIGVPQFSSDRIEARVLNAGRVPRYVRLVRELVAAVRDGYSTTFVRISPRAGLLAVAVRQVCGGKVFFWHSGTTLAFDREQPWTLKKAWWLLTTRIPARLVQRFSDFVVTGPESMVEYYVAEAGIERSRIRLLYNDIDLERFGRQDREGQARNKRRSDLDIPQGASLLLFVHRLSPVRKTLLYLPFLAQQLMKVHKRTDFVCVVVGSGPELPALRAAVADAQLDSMFRFLGDVPNAEIQELYWCADIFVQATYNEGFPRVLLEAMAAGLAVASTDAGGTRDIVGDSQREFVVGRDDRDGLARKVAVLMENAEKRSELARENLLVVERFSTPRVAEMYERVLFE